MPTPIMSPSESANTQPESFSFRRLRLSFSLRFWLLAIEIAGLVFVVSRWGKLAGRLALVGILAEWVLFLVGRKPRWAWLAPVGLLGALIAAMEHAVPTDLSRGAAYVAILLAVAAEIVHLRSIWRSKPLPEGVTPLHRPAPPLRPVVREHVPHHTKPHGFVPSPPAPAPVPAPIPTPAPAPAPAPVPTPRDEDDLLALLFPELEPEPVPTSAPVAPTPAPVVPVPTPAPVPVPTDEDRWSTEDELISALIDEDELVEQEPEPEPEPKVEVEGVQTAPKIGRFLSFASLPRLPHRSRLGLVSVPMPGGAVVPVLASKTSTVLICVGSKLAEWSDLGDFLMDLERAPGLVLATIVAPAGEVQTTWYLEVSRPPSEALVLARSLFSHLTIAPYTVVEHAEEATGARLDVVDGGLVKVEDRYFSVSVAVAPLGGGTIDHVCAGAQRLAVLGRDIVLQGKLLSGISWVLADVTRPSTEQVEDIEVFLSERDNELLTRGLFVVSPPPGQAKEILKWSV